MASDTIFHVLRTRTELKDPAGYKEIVDVFGTYTELQAAKKAAREVLLNEGYEKEWFSVYDLKGDGLDDTWKHGDGMIVYAVAPEVGASEKEGQELFKVFIETEQNQLGLSGNEQGLVQESLYYVLQTTIHYDLDRSGAKRETTVEGTYRRCTEAKEKATSVLLDCGMSKRDFVEYEENDGSSNWPYGQDIIVRAVAEGGENYLVIVVKGKVGG
ncbi:hypothetical protein NA57DRAFT_76752 [Rhizodiscina lignyota]|uniref:Uncharacterized protein n=1 Tax=Rhizodiscina lignyota TaxID=1504668 RepID=A0A9P4IGA7_9PEZI|nr:hypothetical protein NA57DRAFT_76752 [Rhizodiscina lignyota]